MNSLFKNIGKKTVAAVTKKTAGQKLGAAVQKHGVMIATHVATAVGTIVLMTYGKSSLRNAGSKIAEAISDAQRKINEGAETLRSTVEHASTNLDPLAKFKMGFVELADRITAKLSNIEDGATKQKIEALIEALRNISNPNDLLEVLPLFAAVDLTTVLTAEEQERLGKLAGQNLNANDLLASIGHASEDALLGKAK